MRSSRMISRLKPIGNGSHSASTTPHRLPIGSGDAVAWNGHAKPSRARDLRNLVKPRNPWKTPHLIQTKELGLRKNHYMLIPLKLLDLNKELRTEISQFHNRSATKLRSIQPEINNLPAKSLHTIFCESAPFVFRNLQKTRGEGGTPVRQAVHCSSAIDKCRSNTAMPSSNC
jgi:hypothetical protein